MAISTANILKVRSMGMVKIVKGGLRLEGKLEAELHPKIINSPGTLIGSTP